MKAKLATAGLLAALNLVLWGALLPHLNSRKEAELAAYNKLRDQASGSRIASFQDIYTAKEKLGEYEKKFRERKDFAKLITYLFDQSMAAKVDISNIGYNFEEKKDLKLIRLTMNIATAGRYDGVRKFMYNLESGTHFLQIDSMRLARQGEGVSANLVVMTYLKGGYDR